MDYTADQTRRLKFKFIECCRQVCPGFTVDDQNRRAVQDIFAWCLMADGPLDPNKGLLLWGDIGTGKTTLMQAVRLFCPYIIDRVEDQLDYCHRTVNAIKACADFSARGYQAIESLCTDKRICIDELGSETTPTLYYGSAENVWQYILQRRYDLGRDRCLTHATTNITPQELASRYGARIFDRATQMFNFVEMRGYSRR